MTTSWNDRDAAPCFETAERAVHALLEHRAEDVVILDLRPHSDVADVFIIATGTSETQVGALAGAVEDALREEGEKPLHVEGLDSKHWALLDYVDLVVHVMLPRTREYYNLERLWNDVVRIEAPEDYFTRPDVAARHPELPLVRRGEAVLQQRSDEADEA